MFKLIDYREDEWSDGFGGQIDYYYKLRNVNTDEEIWVNEYEFKNKEELDEYIANDSRNQDIIYVDNYDYNFKKKINEFRLI